MGSTRAAGEPVGEASSDSEVLHGFADGAREGASPCLHIENEVLYASGWWTLAIRLDAGVFLVRTDPHATTTDRITEELQTLFRRKGLALVDRDPPLADVVTLQAASLIGASWAVWARDPEHAREALRRWAHGTQDAIPAASVQRDAEGSVRFQLEVAQRIVQDRSEARSGTPSGDIPPPRLLLLDVEPALAEALKAEMPDCEVIEESTHTATSVELGCLAPMVILVDVGRVDHERILALRAACGRFLPIVGVRGAEAGDSRGIDTLITRPFLPGALAAMLRSYLPSRCSQ